MRTRGDIEAFLRLFVPHPSPWHVDYIVAALTASDNGTFRQQIQQTRRKPSQDFKPRKTLSS